MKNGIILISIFVFTFVLVTISSSAYDDCKFACPEIEWQSSGSTPFSVPSCLGCNFIAYWSYRYLDCPELGVNWCDYKLDSISCVGCPPSCWSCSSIYTLTHSAMSTVIDQVARFSVCVQELPNDSCIANFSINYSSCWQYTSSGPGGPSGLKPCDETQCCKEIWKYCKDSVGNITGPFLVSQWGLNPVCESGQCITICEEFTPPPTINNINENGIFNHSLKTKVFPNPSADLINLQIESDTESELMIEIIDISGNIIATKNIVKKQSEIQLQFKLSSFSNGIYYFIVKQNGKQVSSASFNILK